MREVPGARTRVGSGTVDTLVAGLTVNFTPKVAHGMRPQDR